MGPPVIWVLGIYEKVADEDNDNYVYVWNKWP